MSNASDMRRQFEEMDVTSVIQSSAANVIRNNSDVEVSHMQQTNKMSPLA